MTVPPTSPKAMDSQHYLDKCSVELKTAVAALGGDPSHPRLDAIAELIIMSMTGPWRSFHTPEHIFEVGDGGSPVEVVAALFHDLVYAQVDSGIHLNLARYVAPFVREGKTGLLIEPQSLVPDAELNLVMGLFGLQVGQVLSPFAGQNEFLSALLAVKILDGILPLGVRAQIAVCIEATIPFRADPVAGDNCSETLLLRLKQTNLDHALGLSDAECLHAVHMAVRVANRDIGNFASESPSEFLNNTWNLIPETNHDLVSADTYSITGYRISLQKMEGFLGFLKPEVVFRQFRSEPSDAEHQRRLTLTRTNLEVARLYIQLKLVSIALLEALSLRLGQQVALASIMGKLPSRGDYPIQLEQHLPKVQTAYQPQTPLEVVVMDLLESGRSADSLHDARHSPVASYMVKVMGMPTCMFLLAQSRLFFTDQLSAAELIASTDANVIHGIEQAVVSVYHQRARVFSNA
jgi:hypothetical protein